MSFYTIFAYLLLICVVLQENICRHCNLCRKTINLQLKLAILHAKFLLNNFMMFRCNGTVECLDESDEENCDACTSDTWRCHDGLVGSCYLNFYVVLSEAEFKKSKLFRWTAENRYQLSAGSNLGTLKTISSGTPCLSLFSNLRHWTNSFNPASDFFTFS